MYQQFKVFANFTTLLLCICRGSLMAYKFFKLSQEFKSRLYFITAF